MFAELKDLPEKIASTGLESPTPLIIGKVVELSPFLAYSNKTRIIFNASMIDAYKKYYYRQACEDEGLVSLHTKGFTVFAKMKNLCVTIAVSIGDVGFAQKRPQPRFCSPYVFDFAANNGTTQSRVSTNDRAGIIRHERLNEF
ncbi:hypothetical protein KIW84_055264 [Lathyrus oleraceus]|uniref:Uncharacterized protein n=1 Tax=Pisum sativum TaxID=3888 RepID=A0A9D4WXS9_PEA|nr:hypothetical protein KIW84_055264 [Pisum sativum]